jgi:hypothetical protein
MTAAPMIPDPLAERWRIRREANAAGAADLAARHDGQPTDAARIMSGMALAFADCVSDIALLAVSLREAAAELPARSPRAAALREVAGLLDAEPDPRPAASATVANGASRKTGATRR